MVDFKIVTANEFQEPEAPWKKVEGYERKVESYTLIKFTRNLSTRELACHFFAAMLQTVPSMLCNYSNWFWPSKQVCRLWKQVFVTQTESIRFGFTKHVERRDRIEEVRSSLSAFSVTLKNLSDENCRDEWKRLETESLISISQRKFDIAKENEACNRYSDILPDDDNIPECPSNSYINASWIEYRGLRRIAAQGPIGPEEKRKKTTVGDFLSMVHHHRATILCLTNHEEYSERSESFVPKCGYYWKPGQVTQISDELWCVASDKAKIIAVKGEQKLVEYTLEVQDHEANVQQTIRMIHYQNWKDFTPPDIQLAARLKEEIGPDELVVSHCSAGIGRTGTFTAIECICKDIEDQLGQGIALPDVQVNIPHTILELRGQRNGMVMTYEQYRSIVAFIVAYYKSKCAELI